MNRILSKPCHIVLPFRNGHAGFLGVMMPDALSFQCFNNDFKPLKNPSKYTDDMPANANTTRHARIIIRHKANTKLFDVYKDVVQRLQNQCQEAIHEDYFVKLEDLSPSAFMIKSSMDTLKLT